MTTTEQASGAATEEFIGRIVGSAIGALDLAMLYVGDRLGLYRALAGGVGMTIAEVAAKAGLNQRYTQEWLEHQAATGFLRVDDAGLAPYDRRFSLPAEHAEALVDRESPYSIAPLAQAAMATFKVIDRVLDAYKTGGGVAWADYGAEMLESQGDFNRPWLLGQLAQEYLASIPDIHARLQASPPARVLDVATGFGWSAIGVALGYPNVTVLGVDIDPASIESAKANAEAKGVDGRVHFEARDAASLAAEEPFDLAIIIEAVHDMSDPVGVLSAVRRALAPGASLFVVDERVAEKFTAPGDDVDRLMYGISALVCLPAGMADQPSAATGTVMRPDTFRRYATDAGFTHFEVLDIENPLFRFYRLR